MQRQAMQVDVHGAIKKSSVAAGGDANTQEGEVADKGGSGPDAMQGHVNSVAMNIRVAITAPVSSLADKQNVMELGKNGKRSGTYKRLKGRNSAEERKGEGEPLTEGGLIGTKRGTDAMEIEEDGGVKIRTRVEGEGEPKEKEAQVNVGLPG
jgi:hypothetical protein